MDSGKLNAIRIEPAQRQRPRKPFALLFAGVVGITLAAAWFARPGQRDERIATRGGEAAPAAAAPARSAATPPPAPPAQPGDVVLTVSGYIINSQRIEISPRVMGLVEWIGVNKGDAVKKDEVIVRLDDAEQRGRVKEATARAATTRATAEKARILWQRSRKLQQSGAASAAAEEDARLALAEAEAAVLEAEAALEVAQTQLGWMVIRAPLDGVVLEKLAHTGELVMPQSFGGTHGPSTALIAVADPGQLQVEVDVSESDLRKVAPGQKARVSPEAYPDRQYSAYVAEIAPEANRQKGTLQIKVQVENPDRYLTPELSAKVEFLKMQ